MKNIVVCEECGRNQLGVVNSRNHNGVIYRRRKCFYCGHKITTYEVHADDFVNIDRVDKLKTIEGLGLEELEEWELENFMKVMQILNSMLIAIAKPTD